MAIGTPRDVPGAGRIEFWFDFASTYSYLSVMRIEDDAARLGVRVLWKPFLLGPVFKALGWDNSPFLIQKEKGEYMWKDIARLCAKYDIPWHRPATFPHLAVLPLRVALIGAEMPWVGEFSRRIMMLNFASELDHDINSDAVVGEVLDRMGLPARALIAEACSQPIKQRLKEQTEAARMKGIFGAPSFFVGDEMFWGNDRLDDALAFAAGKGAS